MGHPAENLSFYDATEYSAEQLSALEEGKMKASSVIQIEGLRKTVGAQIRKARMEDTISEKDAEAFDKELQAAQTDQTAVWRIAGTVKQVIGESKQLVSDVTREILGAKGVDIDSELARFKTLSIAEKRDYKKDLGAKIESLRGLYERVLKISPELLPELDRLHGKEREHFLKELEDRCANIERYEGFLEEGKKHFSQESLKQFKLEFRLLSPSKQEEWIVKFKNDYLKPREKLTERYKLLPSLYKLDIPDFFELSRHEKEAKLDKVEAQIAFDRIVDKGEDSPYVADASKNFAKDMFRQSEGPLRKDMMAMVKKHLKAEADLYRKFIKLSPEVRDQYPDFIQRSFEAKQRILDGSAKEGIEAGALVDKYLEKLTDELQKRNISAQNFLDFERWFKVQNLANRQYALRDDVFAQQMRHRIRLREAFERLPVKVQQENQQFYNLTYDEKPPRLSRLALYLQLTRDQQETSPQGADTKPETSAQTSQQNFEATPGVENISDAENVLGQRKNTPALEPSDTEIDKALDETISDDTMVKQEIVDLNIAEGIQRLVQKSDQYNKGVARSEDKEAHLRTSQERELNEQLVEHTEGGSIIGQEDGKAKKVEKVDLRLFKTKQENRQQLRQEVVSHPDENSQQDVNHLQLTNSAGQEVSGEVGKTTIDDQTAEVIDLATRRAARKIETKRGKHLDDKTKKKIKERIADEDLEVDLKQASGF